MESAEYRTLYALETDYWWFRNLHDVLCDILAREIPQGGTLLDAGSGTGGLLRRLQQMGAGYGFDLSADASYFWAERGVKRQSVRANINELPYPDNCFDAVVSVDILECDGVYDLQAYHELVRAAKPGGIIIIVVPAYQWMMTRGHHTAVHAVRRYNKASVRALAEGAPLTVERVTHFFAALFPIVGGVRLWHRWQERRGEVEIKSELEPLSPLVNKTLYTLTNLERYALRYANMPFGSSLIMVARKHSIS